MAQCPPLVALISSPTAQSIAISRGFKSMSHILYPFGTHELHIREPVNNQPISHKIQLDVRDISNDGHLLSLSVLPYVLVQALKSCSNVNESINLFRKVLLRWAEPSEHESFGAYLACMFVVTSVDENPISELSKLIQTQQTLYNSNSKIIFPPHCCAPKWATSHATTPKHYILLHDSTNVGSSLKKDEYFEQMCTTYGKENCQLLEFDSREECQVPLAQNWFEIDELNDILNRGLVDAMKSASESNTSTPGSLVPGQTPTTPSSVSTISSTLPNVTSVSPNVTSPSSTSSAFFKSGSKIFSQEEATKCANVLNKFLTNCLLPHVEKEMKSLHELVGNRRSLIGKSITSGVRKWFTTGSQSNMAAPMSYSWDSPEMQIRRLADLAFQFGNYAFAYQQYRVLKKDLEVDQAFVAHALASEMCAAALHIAQPALNSKQFPLHYLENAINNLLNQSSKYSYVLRCAFNSADILSDLECFKEGANTISRLSSIDGDHLVGVSQAFAAKLFEKAKMHRKASFYRVLAANRFSTAGISNLAFDCYSLALPSFDEKHWGVLDEHLSMKLLSEGEKAGMMTSKVALECVRRLVAVCPKLAPNLQADRLRKVIYVLDAYSQTEPVFLNIPKVDFDGIKVIYGERPQWNEIDEDENKKMTPDGWVNIERAAHYCLFGTSAPFCGMQLVSDSHSDNRKVRETPIGERFRVMIELTNPLEIGIELRNVRLSVDDIETENQKPSSECMDVGELEQLRMEANESKVIELYVFPRAGCLKFRVDALLFRLVMEEQNIGVSIRIPLEVKGKRLNKTSKQQKSKVYAPDERLSANVARKSWPLVEFRMVKTPTRWAYCDQAMQYVVEVENIGKEDVVSMCLTTNGFDRMAAGIEVGAQKHDVAEQVASNDPQLANFSFNGEDGSPFLRVGEKKRIFFDVRGGDEPTSSTSTIGPNVQKAPATVIIFGYRGTNGTMREWRKIVDCERRRLISITSNLLDREKPMFSLNFKNCLSVNQAALSRVSILRVRSAINGDRGELRRLEIIKSRKLEIESDQSDTLIIKMMGDSSEVWLSQQQQQESVSNIPKWPCPAVIESYNDTDVKIYRKIGILWKANIVNNEGHVSTLLGETFVDDPLELDTSRCAPAMTRLRVSCSAQQTISHDFSTNRICEVPVSIKITNNDEKSADVRIRFVSKLKEAVDGVHLVPPETRQQMWVDRPIRKAILAPNDQKELVMKIRVSHASVYDIGGNNLTVDAIFGDELGDRFSFKVPSILSVVKAI